jgi:hypothetical protein
MAAIGRRKRDDMKSKENEEAAAQRSISATRISGISKRFSASSSATPR